MNLKLLVQDSLFYFYHIAKQNKIFTILPFVKQIKKSYQTIGF